MQIKNNHAKYLYNKWGIGILKLVLFGGCVYFIITKLQDKSSDIEQITLPKGFAYTLAVVLGLMIFNWYLEALRWKVSLQTFEPISIKKAWQVVLVGLSLNWILPFTSGDLIARLSQQHDKYQTTAAAILNRGIMICFTAIIGFYGVSKFSVVQQKSAWYFLVLVAVLGLIFWLFRKSLIRFIGYFQNINQSVFIRVLGISLLRYVVFVFQFFLLLKMFLPQISNELIIAGIGWIFLIRTSLPLLFGGVGVREASGIMFFEHHVIDLQMVILPIFLIWIINTVIPSLVGLILIWRFQTNIVR